MRFFLLISVLMTMGCFDFAGITNPPKVVDPNAKTEEEEPSVPDDPANMAAPGNVSPGSPGGGPGDPNAAGGPGGPLGDPSAAGGPVGPSGPPGGPTGPPSP